MIITHADFTGDYSIAYTPSNAKRIDAIIASKERDIMRDLVGDLIYQDILDSTLGGGSITPTPELEAIYNEIREQHGCHVHKSEGMKVMLAKLIYFYIARNGFSGNTPLGDRKAIAEVSDGFDTDTMRFLYNQGIDSYFAIQYYIGQNKELYPNYSGLRREYIGLY